MQLKPYTTIYFHDGTDVRSAQVITRELPRLAGVQTFWRDDVTTDDEDERGRKIKAKIAQVMP